MPRKGQSAFGLPDLIAAIGTVALLALLVLATAATTRDKSMRAQCVNNLHQINLALRLCADENNDSVPMCPIPGSSAFPYLSGDSGVGLNDLNCAAANNITNSGVPKEALYCPGFVSSQGGGLSWWQYESLGIPANLNTTRVRYCVAGYYFLIMRNNPTAPPGSVPGGNQDPVINDTSFLITKLSRPITVVSNSVTNTIPFSAATLAADIVLSVRGNTATPIYSGLGFNSANLGTDVLPTILASGGYASSHLNSSGQATGANTLFQDGHVAWKPLAVLTSFDWQVGSSVAGNHLGGERWESYYDYLNDPSR
jgi:prepilin-type processing-associated H-X9-DG protein